MAVTNSSFFSFRGPEFFPAPTWWQTTTWHLPLASASIRHACGAETYMLAKHPYAYLRSLQQCRRFQFYPSLLIFGLFWCVCLIFIYLCFLVTGSIVIRWHCVLLYYNICYSIIVPTDRFPKQKSLEQKRSMVVHALFPSHGRLRQEVKTRESSQNLD